MPTYLTPGLYKEEVFPVPAAGLQTGVPAFLGFAASSDSSPRALTRWAQFESTYKPEAGSYLGSVVRGFFENGGALCYVVPLDSAADALSRVIGRLREEHGREPTPEEIADGMTRETLRGGPVALDKGLQALAETDSIDLVCAPDIMRPAREGGALDKTAVQAMQTAVLGHCRELGDRFAILDGLPSTGLSVDGSIEQALGHREGLRGSFGALYCPWVVTSLGATPPCGHIAGAYARSDRRVGVQKAPANEALEGVLDVEVQFTGAQQGRLNPLGVNALRAFPGRGIRVWGARTLSSDPNWVFINVRRLFITVARWVEQNLAGAAFEPNDLRLWTRIQRELTGYCNTLFRQGALKGRTPEEAFYIKCDAETNPPEARDKGQVTTELGLAPGIPNEYVVVRIVHGDGGTTISASA